MMLVILLFFVIEVTHTYLSWSVDRTDSTITVVWSTTDSTGSRAQYGLTENYTEERNNVLFFSLREIHP